MCAFLKSFDAAVQMLGNFFSYAVWSEACLSHAMCSGALVWLVRFDFTAQESGHVCLCALYSAKPGCGRPGPREASGVPLNEGMVGVSLW